MNPITPARASRFSHICLATLICTGCAGPVLDAQWRDPQLTAGYLRGAKVLVRCEAGEVVLQRICEDQLVAGLAARGVTASVAAGPGEAAAARATGAKAVFNVAVAVASQAVSSGVSIGFGSLRGRGGTGLGRSITRGGGSG